MKNIINSFVITTVVVFSIVGAGFAHTSFLSYKSTAYVDFLLTAAEFKIMSERMESAQIFNNYAKYVEQRTTNNPELMTVHLDNLRKTVSAGTANWLEPVYRISKQDEKDLRDEAFKRAQKQDKKESSRSQAIKVADVFVINGYRISSKSHKPENAQQQTTLLAEYVVDANLHELLLSKFHQAVVNNQKLVNSTAAENALRIYRISMLEKRLEQLKRISVAYPAANRLGRYQVVSFEKGSERYIPLPSQMAAVETEILSINESIAQTARRLLQSSAEGKMLAAQSKVIENSTSGRELVTALISDTKVRLANAEEDYDKLILLTYFNDYSELKSKYLELPRFISAPDYSNQPIINPFKVTFGFSVLGLLLALIYQFRNKILALVRVTFWSKSSHSFKTQA